MTEPAPLPSPPGKKTGLRRLLITTTCAVLFPRKQTGVPRRFGASVMLVIMTMYAVLFAAMQTVQVLVHERDPLLFVMVSIFVTGVGLAQAILYGGRQPRKASILAGIILAAPMAFIALVQRHQTLDEPAIIGFLYFISGFGALAGYVAGGAIAGVFLLLNKVQPPLDDPEDEGPAAEEDSQDLPADRADRG